MVSRRGFVGAVFGIGTGVYRGRLLEQQYRDEHESIEEYLGHEEEYI